MKIAAVCLVAFSFTTLALASRPVIRCKGVNDPTYEVTVKEGRPLGRGEIRALPAAIKRKISGAETVSSYTMTIFRGEAVPQKVAAIGATVDVLLTVFSLTGPEMMSTYLDELGANDISSTLKVDGKYIDMSCE